VEGIDVSVLRTGDPIERTLVRVRDRVRTADRVVVGRTVTVTAHTPSIDTVLATTTAFHLVTRVCNNNELASYLINAQPLPAHSPATDDNSLIGCTSHDLTEGR